MRPRLLPHSGHIRSVVLFSLLLIANLSAQAQVTPLPPAEFREQIDRLPGDVGPTLNLYQPETDIYSADRTTIQTDGAHHIDVSAFAQIRSSPAPNLGGPLLSVSGLSTVTGPRDATAEGISLSTQVDYYFAVRAAPSITSIPILLPVNWSLHASQSGQGMANVRASIQVFRMVFNPLPIMFEFSPYVSVGPGTPTADYVDSTTIPLSVSNTAEYGEYYRVRMKLTGFAYRTTGGGRAPNATGLFSGVLDPLPYVDPSFADADTVSIEYSPNLFLISANAPEPSPLSLFFLIALPFLGGMRFLSSYLGRDGIGHRGVDSLPYVCQVR